MINLFKVFMSPTAAKEVEQVLNSGFIGQGPQVEYFEKELKHIFSNDYILTVNSGTSALTLAMYLIKQKDFKDTDELIVAPLTCFATCSAIIDNGFSIKWADMDPKTCNIDMQDVERKLGPNTRGLVLVHWGGTPNDLNYVKSLKQKYQKTYGRELFVIEDCAHCWNSRYNNELIGNSGNFCCFSLQAIKFLTSGDGGLLILPNAEYYYRAKKLRWFGLDRDAGASFRCLHRDCTIKMADGTTKKIIDIVNNKNPGPIMVNENGLLTEKKIINWHKSNLNKRKYYSIQTNSKNKTIVTEDHLILLKDNIWKQVKDVKPNDYVCTSSPGLSSIQKQVLIGSLLGKGKISNKTYKEKNEKLYLSLKAACFKGLSPILEENVLKIKSLPTFDKDLTKENFTPLILAIWFMDKGNTTKNLKSYISTKSKDTCKFFTNLGYNCKIINNRLTFTKKSSKKLLELIAPYVPPIMRHKLRYNTLKSFDKTLYGNGESLVTYDKVTIKKYKGKKKNYQDTYCLTMEGDGYNFCTNEVVVHNCIQNIKESGFKQHLNDIASVIARCNLPSIDQNVNIHKNNASFYNEKLKNVSGVTLFDQPSNIESSYWIYTMKVQDRVNFIKHLKANEIEASQVHNRCDIHDCVSQYKSFLPGMDELESSYVCIPNGWWVTEENREHIVNVIKKGW